MALERERLETWGSGRAVLRERIPLLGGPRVFQEYCRGFERRWIRRPASGEPLPGLRGACGAVWSLVIVDADEEGISWLRGGFSRPVVAYHPEDTGRWFFNREACEAADESAGSP